MNAANLSATVMAGIPASNKALYHRIRFAVGDPAALVELIDAEGNATTTLILRDIEMERAARHARANRVACPADFAPEGGLSGDRETATAQAVGELLRRAGAVRVTADRSLPLIYAHEIQRVGITVACDTEMGVLKRRRKDEQEIEWLRDAQQATEGAMEMACRTIAQAAARGDGVLVADSELLTAERVRSLIDVWLLERGYSNPTSIVAGGLAGADCHDLGSGELRTEQPIIIDIFPRNRATLYNGDCTRTVVHGRISRELHEMHDTVVAAKAAATAAARVGVTGEAVHGATAEVITSRGYAMGLPAEDSPADYCGMTHGTGHGIGLDVHEPPLLDRGGPPLVLGDALTIEPGLYCREIGGVRVEDMVIVGADSCENLNQLPEGLSWS